MPASPLSDAQAQRLIQLYDGAEKEILTEINRLLLKDPASESYSMAWQKTLLQRVQQIRADLLKGSRTWCLEAIPDSYMKGMEWADKDPLMGGKAIPGFGSIHEQAAQVLAENTYNRLQDVNQVVGRKVGDLTRAISLEASKGSVLGYQTTRQAAKRIKADLAEKGITGFVDKAGRSWDMGRYARVLAQETTNGAFRQGSINRYQEHGHDLVRISSHSGSCPKCRPWEGRTMSLSGRDPDYPSVDEARGAGVFHVGCLHVLSLAPEEKDRYIAGLKDRADKIRAEAPPVVAFVPAKSLKEAEEWAASRGIIADYKKMPLETANMINAAAKMLPEGVNPAYISDVKNFYKALGRKMDRKAASIYGVNVEALEYEIDGKKFFKNAHLVGINTNEYKTLDAITTRKKEVQDAYKAKTGRDYFVNVDGKITPHHEMGHIVYDVKVKGWDPLAHRWRDDSKIDILNSESEAFAEAWGAYHGGNRDALPEYIIKFIEGM